MRRASLIVPNNGRAELEPVQYAAAGYAVVVRVGFA